MRPLTGGVSATLHALQLTGPDGTREVVVREHAAARMEARLLPILADRGFRVPRVLGTVDDPPAYAMAFIEGTTELAPDEVHGAIPQMADYLARLHRVRPLPSGLPELEDPQAHLPAYLGASGGLEPRIRQALASRPPWRNRNAEALLHGDYWPGNVLWSAGELAAVIDWEDAAIGDPNADLAGARVELLCRYGADAMEAFTARYLRMNPIDTSDLALWELYSSCAALSSMGDWGLPPDVEAERRERTRAFMERAARAWIQ